MPARRAWTRKPPSPSVSEFGLYSCESCTRPLELERVLRADVDRDDEGVFTGYVAFEHTCRCSPGELHISASWGSYPAFLALFGAQPELPYEATFRWTDVAADNGDVQRWGWELSQVSDWDDFMLFLDDHQR